MTSLDKLVKEKNVCSLPWILAEVQLHKHHLGPCCKYEENLGSLKDNELPVVWFGEKFKNFRQRMADGNPLEGCKTCYIGDSVFSYKDKKNKDFARILPNVDVDNPALPKVMHIGLTNICNLACRMCNPDRSSKLLQVINKTEKLKTFYPTFYADNNINPKNLKGSFSEILTVSFMGGEPMIDESCLEILKMIKEESKNLKEVTFITNLTKLNTDILDIVYGLGVRVTLAVSIDGPPYLQEYIRHLSKWDDVYRNMKYIREKYPRIRFGFNSTISILNVGYVADTVKFIHSLEEDLRTRFDYCLPSIVTDKEYLYPSNLPNHIKELYIQRIDNFKGRLTIPQIDQLLTSAKGLLQEHPKQPFDKFIDFISEFDNVAKTDYKTIYPEFGADGGN